MLSVAKFIFSYGGGMQEKRLHVRGARCRKNYDDKVALGPPKCCHVYVRFMVPKCFISNEDTRAPKSHWGSFGYHKALEATWVPRSRANEATSR